MSAADTLPVWCRRCRAVCDYSCQCPDGRPEFPLVTEKEMLADSRQRGEWRATPWLLRKLGWPARRRTIIADWRIGGGWDGWEYAAAPQSIEEHT